MCHFLSSVKDAKRRYRNMRDVYVRLRKQLLSSDMAEGKKRIRWPFYNLMHSYLGPYVLTSRYAT